MSEIIRILPNHVVYKIAAGESIQRPASVVKELLENAVDADAKSIHLIIQDAGKSLIKVIDDGRGMSIKDARMSFLRYATSKIKTTDDLLKIKTMGFRGEALASIAAVCQVEMQTRRKEDEIGVSIFIEGNKFKGERYVRASKGTSVTVKNIFYNVTERRKFLKSNHVELIKIIDEFNRLALANPKIRFILFNYRNKNINKYFDFTPNSLKNRIVEVLGFNEELISIDEHISGIYLKGYIVNPSYSSKSLRNQFIFVNNRFIKNSYLSKTILKAFKGSIKHGNNPSYFLFFFLDPKTIDVNFNNTKNEIRFEEENSISTILYNSIRGALNSYIIKTSKTSSSNLKLYANYNPLFNINDGLNISIKKLYEQIQQSQSTNNINLCSTELFQWDKKYIISIFHSDLIIIDQHRAHKRIFYEYFLSNKNSTSKQLQFPISLLFSTIQLNLLKKVKKYLVSMGFSISFPVSSEKIIVEATPIEMNQYQVNNFFNTFLMNFTEDISSYQEIKILDILASSIASSIAIKHGFSLSVKDMKHIIYELFYLCTKPNFSPEGEKVFVTLNNNSIKKLFLI